MSHSEIDLLRAVRDGNVTWNRNSWRLWASEDTYTLVTKPMRQMRANGLVDQHMATGYRFIQRGPAALTQNGRRRLRALEEAKADAEEALARYAATHDHDTADPRALKAFQEMVAKGLPPFQLSSERDFE
jgi:hypothetical protein